MVQVRAERHEKDRGLAGVNPDARLEDALKLGEDIQAKANFVIEKAMPCDVIEVEADDLR